MKSITSRNIARSLKNIIALRRTNAAFPQSNTRQVAPSYLVDTRAEPQPAVMRPPAHFDTQRRPGDDDTPTSPTSTTVEQETVLQLAKDGASLFIGGRAGTGKSFLLRCIAETLRRDKGLTVSVSATTGIAALNIEGNTFHSTFGVPVITADSLSRGGTEIVDAWSDEGERTDSDMAWRPRSHVIRFSTERLVGVQVMIIDEVSLLHAGYLESLERCCRRVAGNDPRKPFGGVQVILSGDFLQLTPFDGTSPLGQSSTHRGVASGRERYHCPGVWKDKIIAEGEAKIDGDDDDSHDAGHDAADKVASPVPTDSPVVVVANPSQHALAGYHQTSLRHRRMRAAKYNTRPLYASYVFQRCLVHVQLTTPARHREDKLFLAELNLLRVGQMPWRLARSAFLNAPDDDAIRLFPTKAAVKNHNDRRMLELSGPTVPFRSVLSLSPVKRRGHALLSRSRLPASTSRGDAARRSFLSEPVVLSVARDVRRLHRRSLSYTEAHALVDALLAEVPPETQSPPLVGKHILTLPSPYQDASRFGRLVVRLECDTAERAQWWHNTLAHAARTRLVAVAAREWPTHRHAASITLRLGLREASRRRRKAPDTPCVSTAMPNANAWRLIQVNGMSAGQVLALARPALQEQFASVRKTDPLLSDKELKVGCRVMLLRNLTDTLVNGTVGTVVRFVSHKDCGDLLPRETLKVMLAPAMHAQDPQNQMEDTAHKASLSSPSHTLHESSTPVPIVRLDGTGRLVAIPWISVAVPDSPHDGFFRSRVECMPLTPAYAFTVHKTQGITFDQPVLFDGEQMFSCDHIVYVAASRVRRFSQLRMVNVSPRAVTVHRPSLAFCEQLPCVPAAVRHWAAWKSSGKESFSTLFMPSWKECVSP